MAPSSAEDDLAQGLARPRREVARSQILRQLMGIADGKMGGVTAGATLIGLVHFQPGSTSNASGFPKAWRAWNSVNGAMGEAIRRCE